MVVRCTFWKDTSSDLKLSGVACGDDSTTRRQHDIGVRRVTSDAPMQGNPLHRRASGLGYR